MIKKLKFKFLLLSMISLFILLAIILIVMNVINFRTIVNEADEILSLLSRNKGAFPGFEGEPDFDAEPPSNEKEDRLPPNMSPELPYEARYFSVILGKHGEVLLVDTDHIATVNDEAAVTYAHNISKNKGFEDSFRYLRANEGDAIRVTFLDCQRQLSVLNKFMLTGILIALGGFLIVFLVMFFCSERIIRPIVESYEKQKRFITDAGHEIKTPLTIINANVDILEMELGKHESLSDIQQQTKRLTALTNDLVYLARMEEAEHSLQMIEFPLSEIVQDTTSPFGALAQTQNKSFSLRIQPMLSMKGNPKAIEQLVSILLDNAIKYSPADGRIELMLSKQSRGIALSVVNTTAAPIDREALPHVFDRFYRTDRSRNSGTGGHGIGLSVAKAIVAAHAGRINVFADGDHTFGITAVFFS